MRLFGLIGYPLGHSFSQTYFRNKFEREQITGCDYLNFPLAAIGELREILDKHPDLEGINVTIPYKQQVLPFAHQLTGAVAACGAANCLHIQKGRITAYNTDVIGFERSLRPLLLAHHKKALVLGTGGAARAVEYVLTRLGIEYLLVSRTAGEDTGRQTISYADVDASMLETHSLIVNTSPVGMWPEVDECPAIPYEHLTSRHLLYDLIYRPEITRFLQLGAARGAAIKNGYEMLELQAESSWEIWNGTAAAAAEL